MTESVQSVKCFSTINQYQCSHFKYHKFKQPIMTQRERTVFPPFHCSW